MGGSVKTLGADPAEGRGPLAPHRVHQHPVAIQLHEEDRVTEPRDPQTAGWGVLKLGAAPGDHRELGVGTSRVGAFEPLPEHVEKRRVLPNQRVFEPPILPLGRDLHFCEASALGGSSGSGACSHGSQTSYCGKNYGTEGGSVPFGPSPTPGVLSLGVRVAPEDLPGGRDIR